MEMKSNFWPIAFLISTVFLFSINMFGCSKNDIMDKAFETLTGISADVDENAGDVLSITPSYDENGELYFAGYQKVATPTPTPSELYSTVICDKYVYAKEPVNVRQKATTASNLLGSIDTNDRIHCVGETSDGWSIVGYNHVRAYIRSDYLTDEEPESINTDHIDTIEYMNQVLENGEVCRLLTVGNILQKPDLPSGGEVTCLAIVLDYMGFIVDKVKLANDYLPKGEAGEVSPFEYFIGDPTTNGGYGCYAGPIVKAAEDYLSSQRSKLKVKDISGSQLNTFLMYVAQGTPVICWSTSGLSPSTSGRTWTINGKKVTWRGNECAVVIIGYNMTNKTFIVADPSKGIVAYDMDTFMKRYEEQYSQAIVIN